jgi:hypothetical protein
MQVNKKPKHDEMGQSENFRFAFRPTESASNQSPPGDSQYGPLILLDMRIP